MMLDIESITHLSGDCGMAGEAGTAPSSIPGATQALCAIVIASQTKAHQIRNLDDLFGDFL